MTRLISHFGGIWKLSEVSYTRLLRAVASSETWNLDEFGTYLGQVSVNLTDYTPEQAQDEMASIKQRARRNLRFATSSRLIG